MLDPRLADPVILALAARRAKERQGDPPKRVVQVRVVYVDALGVEPDEIGPTYTYTLPAPTPGGRPW
jgi:hypothetical protein